MQGEIIAGAIAASATADTDGTTIDPRPAARSAAGRKLRPDRRGASPALDFPINPERVAPVLRRLISPTKHARAHLRSRRRTCILDSRNLYMPRRRAALRPAAAERRQAGTVRARLSSRCAAGSGAATCRSIASSGPSNGKDYPEVAQALTGAERQHGARQRPRRGDRLGRGAGAALPRGARRADAVDARRRHRRHGRGRAAADLQGLPRSLPASWWCCRSCSPAPSPARCGGLPKPPNACAGGSARASKFPTSPRRRDEIGHLSGTLRDMTNALYSRIEAIESFAADVAHELKNPLTSLRSAVETLPLRQDRGEPRAAARRHPARRASGSTG